MIKANVYNLNGEKVKQIQLPWCKQPFRPDIILKAYEVLKLNARHRYGAYALAGKEVSASSKQKHRRRRWKSLYGRGISRVPRKILLRRGEQFHWVGAFISGTRGGRRAHPPKPERRTLKINEKEKLKALLNALYACTNIEIVRQRYSKIRDNEEIAKHLASIGLPVIITDLDVDRAKTFKQLLHKIFDKAIDVVLKKKKVRAGKGKMRGRRYKTTAGMLLVIASSEEEKAKRIRNLPIEIVKAKLLSIKHLAPGGHAGRIVMFTEKAINELAERLKQKQNSLAKRKTKKIEKLKIKETEEKTENAEQRNEGKSKITETEKQAEKQSKKQSKSK